ncbi:MAG: hypothetical protein ACRD50_15700 [Candidatus Acidiferrales bacterium]
MNGNLQTITDAWMHEQVNRERIAKGLSPMPLEVTPLSSVTEVFYPEPESLPPPESPQPTEPQGVSLPPDSPILRVLTEAAKKFRTRNTSKSRPAPLDPQRHARLCAICKHRDRAAIEADFLRWADPWDIAEEYDLPGRSAVYRHAHAAGLFARRKLNLACSLEHLIERASGVELTATALVRAVRAYASLNETGGWVEPTKRIVIVHEYHHVSSPDDESVPEFADANAATPAPRANSSSTFDVAENGRTSDSAPRAEAPADAGCPILRPQQRTKGGDSDVAAHSASPRRADTRTTSSAATRSAAAPSAQRQAPAPRPAAPKKIRPEKERTKTILIGTPLRIETDPNY